jgi:hypothetical protein
MTSALLHPLRSITQQSCPSNEKDGTSPQQSMSGRSNLISMDILMAHPQIGIGGEIQNALSLDTIQGDVIAHDAEQEASDVSKTANDP